MSVYSDYGPTVRRFVVTHVAEGGQMKGVRGLSLGAQGRWTWVDRAEAERMLEAFRQPHGLPRVLTSGEVASLKVRECECWAGHFDPCGRWFDDEERLTTRLEDAEA